MLLSVIIISKNEEKNIERCLNSIFNNIRDIEFETILVDSNSTDKTTEIAKKFHCKILKVQSNIYSAALGRQVGLDKSRGKYLLFLDADMELCPYWVKEGLNFLKKSSDSTFGVAGIRKDIIYKDNEVKKILPNVYGIQKIKKTTHFGGAIMLKADYLRAIGGYTISLLANEEPELHSRILKQGYDVYEIPEPMIIHHTPHIRMISKVLSLFSRRNTGIAKGLKYSIKNKTTIFYCRRLKKFLWAIISDYLTMLLLLIFFLFREVSDAGIYIFAILFLLQIMALFYSGSLKRYILNKVLIIPFTIGLIGKSKQVEYRVIEINR